MSEENKNAEFTKDRSEQLVATERHQLKIRFVVTVIAVTALMMAHYTDKSAKVGFDIFPFFAGTNLIIIFAQLIWNWLTKGPKKYSEARIVLGQFFDTGSVSLAFYSYGANAAFGFPIYLFLILGNGMRYGLRPMLISTGMSAVGLALSMLLNDFWSHQYNFMACFLVGLIVIPGYYAVLLKRINKARDLLIENEKSKVQLLHQMDDMKTQFFANISHEFRTPIALTLGSMDIIKKSEFKPDIIEKHFEVINRNQTRLLGLINQILDLEKLEKGKFTLKVQPLASIKQYIEKRAEQFQAMAQKKGLQLNLDLAAELEGAKIYADPEGLDKVLFNLLSNAFKFTSKGTVALKSFLQDKFLVIEVKDSGVGIRADEIGKIFDRFQQATGSQSKDYSGTGIGLSLVKEIIELHHGTVEVESEYGVGTTFRMKLLTGHGHFSPEMIRDTVYSDQPLAAEQYNLVSEGLGDTSGIKAHAERNQKTIENLDSYKKTVLFVDDNYDLREFMADLLGENFNLILGVDGEDGLKWARQIVPDLILSDLMMPKLDGLGFLRAIRSENQFDNTPFVILTAKANDESKVDALEFGVDDYLTKPFTRNEVMVRIKNLLSLREKNQRIKKDLVAAREIQRSLTPNVPKVWPGFDIDALYEPCEDLSGDFFDFTKTASYLWGYVADVTSHGTSSAQVTYIVKSIFSQIIVEHGEKMDVSEMLSLFSRKYYEYQLDYGVGIQLFRLRLEDNELEYVNSNSPAPVIHAGDQMKRIEVRANDLIDPKFVNGTESVFQKINLKLESKSSIYFFTDGCVEFTGARGRPFGERGLEKSLLTVAANKDWKSDLLQIMRTAHESRQFPDDMTVLRLTVQ